MELKARRRLLFTLLSVSAVLAAAAWVGTVPADAQRTIGRPPAGAAVVDFRVLGADGAPLKDLTADQVTISVDGRQRAIQSLKLVEVGGAAGEAPATAVAPPFGTNVMPEGQRNVLVMFNDQSIKAGQEADVKTAISQFVSSLSADDRVALMTTPRGNVRTEFSTDREAFNTALGNVVGRAAPMENADQFTCDTRNVLDELRGIFTGLGAQTVPTYVMFFSAGLAAPTTQAANIGGETGSACELRVDSYQNLATAAAAGRVQMYVLQPEGLTTPQPGNEGLENLAGVTGGQLYRVGSSGSSILQRIAQETSSYYLATIGLEDVPRNGQPHRLEVTVARPGARTVAHSEIVLGSANAGEDAKTPTPQDMLRTEAAFRDLPLRVGGYASRNQPGDSKLKVIAMLEPMESVTFTAVSAGLVTADGRLVAQWTANEEELKMPMVFAALLADPGTYRLRMAATDSAGRAGAADFNIDVKLHKADTVEVSETWTFSTASGQLMPALTYSGDDTAMVLFELYGQPPPGFFAQVELAKTPDGPALQAPQLQAVPGDPNAPPEQAFFRIVGQFPLADLEPGDYVARFTLGKDPQVKLLRTIRKIE